MKRPIKVAIPLKTNSSRVPEKNIRPFYGNKSLFDIKAQQLLEVFNPEDVYVSSEEESVREMVEKYGFHFLKREMFLTSNTVSQAEIINCIVDHIPDEYDIMWTQVTQPLFNEFKNVLDAWEKVGADHDSLAVVERCSHHILDSNGNPVNFSFGYWHKVSQDLPPYYTLTWAAYIMTRDMLKQSSYYIGKKPYLYEVQSTLVDINSIDEFNTASIIYSYHQNKSNIAKVGAADK